VKIMLQSIRESAQSWLAWIIVPILIVPFALWGIHQYLEPSTNIAIAEVNGVELSERDFDIAVQNQKQRLRAMFQQNIDLSFMEQQIRENTLKQLIEEEVLIQASTDGGLRIDDSMLAQQIHDIQAFQQDGAFSQSLYESLLNAQGYSPVFFEMEMRRDLLVGQMREGILRSALWTETADQSRQKLDQQQRLVSYLLVPQSRFEGQVTVTDAEIEQYYNDNLQQKFMTEEKVKVEYVTLSEDKLATKVEVSEEEIQQYYDNNIASFSTEDEWKARHILIKTKPNATDEDIAETEKQAQAIVTRIQAGEDFAELAKTLSEDTDSAKKGGDLGWFGEGRMVKPFENMVKTLKIGEVSQPVKSRFGFHIIELQDKKAQVVKPLEEVKDTILADLQKEQAENVFYSQLEEFQNLAFENPNSLDAIISHLGLEKKSTEFFDRQGLVGDKTFSNRDVIDAAFTNDVLHEGFNSEPIETAEHNVIVLRLKEYKAAEPKPLEAVKVTIQDTLSQQKMREETKKLGESLVEALKQGQSADTLAKDNTLQWTKTQWIKRQDNLDQPELTGIAFKLGYPEKEKALYQGVAMNSGDYALLTVLEVKEGQVETSEEAQTEQALEQQRNAIGETDFGYFVSYLKSVADIKTYRQRLEEE